MKLKILLISIVVTLSVSWGMAAEIVVDFPKDIAGWQTRHFRNPVRLVAKPGPESVILSFTGTGDTAGCYWKTFPCPKNTREVTFTFRYRTSVKVPLSLVISRGVGVEPPAMRHNLEIIADNQWHDISKKYGVIRSFNEMKIPTVTLEFVMEGHVNGSDKFEISHIEVTKQSLPAFDLTYSPQSGQVISGCGSEKIAVNWHVNTGKHMIDSILELDGKVLDQKTNSISAGKTLVQSFDMRKYPEGEYIVKLKDNDKLIRTLNFVKYPSAENSVTIFNRVPYYNGKPYFILGLYHSGDPVISLLNKTNKALGMKEITRDQVFDDLKKRHFNAVHHSWSPGNLDFHLAARKHGLLVLNECNYISPDEALKDRSKYPNVLAWYSQDEPQGEKLDTCIKRYREFKKLDPYHPVVVCFNSVGAELKAPVNDLTFIDYYPVGLPDSNVEKFPMMIDLARKHINKNDPTTCEIAVPQLFAMDGMFIEPTIKQVKAQVYSALVGGAKGIFYYGFYTSEPLKNGMPGNPDRKHWYLPESKLWDQIGDLNSEIVKLQDVYLQGKVVKGVTLPNIQFRAWEYKGYIYLVAVNPYGRNTVSSKLTHPKSWKLTSQLFGSKLEMKNNVVTLGPYGVIVLKFSESN